jgi:hypothetical protein
MYCVIPTAASPLSPPKPNHYLFKFVTAELTAYVNDNGTDVTTSVAL